MKKILLIFPILAIILTGCNNNAEDYEDYEDSDDYSYSEELSEKKEEQENSSKTRKLRKQADLIVDELNEEEPFNNTIVYSDVEFADYNDYTENTTTFNYEVGEAELSITYMNKGNELDSVTLSYYHCDYDEKTFNNQILAITYLDEFDIQESDFDNSNELHSYDGYLLLLAGSIDNHWANTTEEKNLSISRYKQSNSDYFAISK